MPRSCSCSYLCHAATAIDNAPDFSSRGGKSKPIKIFSKSDAEKELELLEKDNAKIITYKSPEYSKLLNL